MIEFLGNVLVIPDPRGGQKKRILGPYEDSNIMDLARKLLGALRKRYGWTALPEGTFVMSQDHYNGVLAQLCEYNEWFQPKLYGVELVSGGYDMDVDLGLVVDFRLKTPN